jgi:hypothetical protein
MPRIRAAPQWRCLEWWVKKKRVGGEAKKRVIDSSSDKSFADTGNKRGITSKKARGVAMRKEESSFSSRTTTRVGKDNLGEEQCKLERHLGYDYTSSSRDLTPEATVYKSAEEEIKHSWRYLLKVINEKDKKIRSLELEISKSKMANQHNKRKVREEYQWTGEETNFTKTVNHFCKNFLFPRYKFLKDGWQDVLPERLDCSVNKDETLKHEMQPEQRHKVNIPEYDEMCIILCFRLCVLYQQTFCSSSLWIYADDTKSVWPDELGEGIKTYIKLNTLKHVNKFMCTYVKWIAPNATWNKRVTNKPNRPFFCCATPSDIAYILYLIKNGKDMLDQTKKRKENPEARHEKRAKPLFSTGEGKRRESGKTVWNNDGLEFFYTAERNWMEVYNSKEQFLRW